MLGLSAYRDGNRLFQREEWDLKMRSGNRQNENRKTKSKSNFFLIQKTG
jgi:hypothetical protein